MRCCKTLKVLLLSLPWLLLLALGLEVYARISAVKIDKYYNANTPKVLTLTVPSPAWPSLAGWQKLTDTEKQTLAAQNKVAILCCSSTGILEAKFDGGGDKEVSELVSLFPPQRFLPDSLSGKESADLAAAFVAAMQRSPIIRTYTLPLPGDRQSTFDFIIRKEGSGLVIMVCLSPWEIPWCKMRAGMSLPDFHINNIGFRGRDVKMPKPPGVVRILCIGSSVVVEGATDDKTYPVMLERMLQQYFNTSRIEVVNCGISALTAENELKRFPDFLALQPDLIVRLGFSIEVCNRIGECIAPQNPLREPVKCIKWVLRNSQFVWQSFNQWLLPSRVDLDANFDEIIFQYYQQEIEAAKKAGVVFALSSFAYPDRLSPKDVHLMDYYFRISKWRGVANQSGFRRLADVYNERVKTMAEENGVLYVPLAENIHGGPDIYADAVHMLEPGLEKKAYVVFSSIKDSVAQLLQTKTTGSMVHAS